MVIILIQKHFEMSILLYMVNLNRQIAEVVGKGKGLEQYKEVRKLL